MTMHSNPLGAITQTEIAGLTLSLATASMETFLARAGSLVFFFSQRFAWPPRCPSLSAWAWSGTRRFDLFFIFYFTLHCTHPSVVPSDFVVNCSFILLSSRSRRRIFSRSVCKRGGHHLMARGFLFFAFFFSLRGKWEEEEDTVH